MSAGAVRQGKVFVEIGADAKGFFGQLSRVNQAVGKVGASVRNVGLGIAGVGGAIVAPFSAAGAAMASETAEVKAATAAIEDIARAVGEAVAPAFVGWAKIVAGAATSVAKFIRENQQLVRQVASVGLVLVGIGAPMAAVGTGVATLSKSLSGFSIVLRPVLSGVVALATSIVGLATSGPVLAIAGVLGAAGVAAKSAGVDFGKLGGVIGSTLQGPINGAISLFGDLGSTASTTIDGMFNAISAGDLGAAVDILWAGVSAAWARGEQSIMGALDPWIEAVQNVFSDFAVGLAVMWEQVWIEMATSEWGGTFLGVMDNVLNAVSAAWDATIGYLQKGWAKFSSWWSGDTAAMEAEIARIDAANASNAESRGRNRPGIEGRTNLSDEQKAKMRADSEARQRAMLEEGDRMRAERAARTKANVGERAAAVDQANANLRSEVAKTSAPPPVTAAGTTTASTAIAGTFSAFGIDQMGSQSVQKQQLDALLKIQAGIEDANRVGGIVA